ncbi:hypothetical protein BH23CHL7_BH23CHL7_03510 [soil metagenome]
MTLTYDGLLKMARRSEGATLQAVTGRRFRVGVYMDVPFFRPDSSGLGQTDGRKPIERFVARYNETGSLRPSDYADVTRSASYLIGLLLAEQGRKRGKEAAAADREGG